MKTQSISLTVNGRAVGPYEIPNGLSMNDFLREYLNLTGTKFGCGMGLCSACVVIVDGADGTSEAIHTCINGADFFAGKAVRTIEGVARNDALTPVQSAFLDHFAFQCGYCTPATRRRCWSNGLLARLSPSRRWRRRSRTPWTATSAAAQAMSVTTRRCAI